MIIHLKESIEEHEAKAIAKSLKAIHIANGTKHILVTSSSLKSIEDEYSEKIEEFFVMDTDMQLSSYKYKNEVREITLGKGVKIGGSTGHTVVIGGPCSVESEEQITHSADLMVELGITTLRAGCYKPRTSPYSFQGMGVEGLKLLDKMRMKFGLNIITEVRDSTHIDEVIEYADIVQIGAKSMYDHGILRRCGKARKPILLKRGFGTTLQEFVQAAEFILSGGNDQVILCERGIRTFETKTRFTLDLCGVAYLKEHCNLPIILDPSHAIGYAYGVPDLARACVALGVDGLLIEVHPEPKVAKSDASQQLNHDEFRELYKTLTPIAQAAGRKII
ncbi:MAG: 3-deoxy-7-phosphoheptulonate synthase [Flavobacteriales bacterium]|nr:3-deoxy-7-phosphoheptulonate synthase [Bacteroidales bacterium AH-315-I05]PCJ84923.1 MAG: 3-deoxy-7-phosphoheptulonate synthase [Flavobacteriales bacterium]